MFKSKDVKLYKPACLTFIDYLKTSWRIFAAHSYQGRFSFELEVEARKYLNVTSFITKAIKCFFSTCVTAMLNM